LTASDIRRGSWLTQFLPAGLQPYATLARLDRPIGTWLLLFPCWWSTALAYLATGNSLDLEFLRLFIMFAIGALVMRGAGCTFNDIVDRDFDRQVARTAERPIPSGQVTTKQAAIFMALQMLVGFAILISLSPFAIAIGVASLLLVFTYPFMKRITYWPQAWLGLTFNWGALVGWAAVRNDLSWPALALYASGIFWTLGYDTIYAHQDKEDDALIGVKSSALRLGNKSRTGIALFYSITVILFAAALFLAMQQRPMMESYTLPTIVLSTALALISLQFVWQVRTLEQDDPQDCLHKFKSNSQIGWLLFLAPLILIVLLGL